MYQVCTCEDKEKNNCPMHGEEIKTTLTTWPVSFKTSDLPRWKPKNVIDRRTLGRGRIDCSKSFAEGFYKGQQSILRKNKSGCCCIIDDNGRVLALCDAHKNFMEEKRKGGDINGYSGNNSNSSVGDLRDIAIYPY